MKTKSDLDRVDIRILEVLQKDARVTNLDLARRVGLSPSPCHRRLRLIEESGLIKSYVALLDRAAAGVEFTAFVEVALQRKDPASYQAFEKAVQARAEVMECHIMTGDSDYMLRIATPGIDSFRKFIMNELLAMPGVERTRTSVSLGEIKYTTALPLGRP